MTGYILIDNKHVLFTYNEDILTLHFDSILEGNKEELNLEKKCISKNLNYLLGYDIEKKCEIVFFTRDVPDNQSIFCSQDIKVYSYIHYAHNVQNITGMQFCSEEIDYFYDTRKGYEMTIKNIKGCELKTKEFIDTRDEILFNDGSDNIKCILGIVASINTNTATPVSLKSMLNLEFDETNDYDKIMKRYGIIKRFFNFICYRKNIDFSEVILLGKNKDGQTVIIGKLCNNYDIGREDISIVKKIVKYDLLKSNIKEIFELIAKDELYTQHIPNTYKEKLIITPARFVLITAAFEWSIRGLYKIPISEKQKKVKDDVIEAISNISKDKEYNRDLRDKLDFYIKIVNNTDVNLSRKISHALNDLSSIIEIFIKNLFYINNKEIDSYNIIGDRIQNQRNNYAHGNIDKEMNMDVILDIIILEWVNYAMILKKVGYSDDNIKKLINVIFNRNFAIN